MKSLKDFFLQELADMFDSEQRITKALPDLIEAATCSTLKSSLESHLRETEGHVEKVERVFRAFGEEPEATKCPAMVGIPKERAELISDNKKSPSLNAAVICAAQKVEHYEIATYGCLHSWAELLGSRQAVDTLKEILDEEKAADRILNSHTAAKNEEALEEAVEEG